MNQNLREIQSENPANTARCFVSRIKSLDNRLATRSLLLTELAPPLSPLCTKPSETLHCVEMVWTVRVNWVFVNVENQIEKYIRYGAMHAVPKQVIRTYK